MQRTLQATHAHGDMVLCVTGVDFKVTGGSVVRYCFSDYLLQEH